MSRTAIFLLTAAVFLVAFCTAMPAEDLARIGPHVPMASASSGPMQRNRVWRLINTTCRPPEGMMPPPTELETNICRVVHRRMSDDQRRSALLALRRLDAIRFYDFQIDMLVAALRRARPPFFVRVVQLVASSSPQGRFLVELTRDIDRVVLVLTDRPVPLE